MPFIQVEVIREMAAYLVDCDAIVPEYNGRLQTLHAFYGSGCLSIAEDLLEQGTTSMHALVSRCRVNKLPQDHFARVPGGLQSFRDLDTAEEYRDAVSGPDIPPS